MTSGDRDDVVSRSEITAGRRGFLRIATWSFVGEGAAQITTIGASVVLAALVGPEAYGIVAIATAYVLLVDVVQRQGIASALIQRRDLTDDHASSAFWLTAATSLVLTAASVLFAPLWATVYGLPDLGAVIVALSTLLPLKALIIVQEALLRRQMKVKQVALRVSAAGVVGSLAGIWYALAEPTVWAFVVQQIVTAFGSVVLLWASTRWRPRLRFSLSSMRDLLGFSVGSFLSSIGVFINNRADVLLIGIFFGPLAVGLYGFCTRLVSAFLALAVRPLQALALPELSPFQGDVQQFRRRLDRLGRSLGIAGLPALGVIFATSPLMIEAVGSAWSDATVPLQLLLLVAAIRVVVGINGPTLQALGRPHLLAFVTWLTAAMSTVIVIVVGLVFADSPVADQVVALVVSRIAFDVSFILVLHLILMRTLLGQSTYASLRPFFSPALSGLVAAVTGTVVSQFEGIQPDLLLGSILMVAGSAAATGVGTLTVTEPKFRAVIQALFAAIRWDPRLQRRRLQPGHNRRRYRPGPPSGDRLRPGQHPAATSDDASRPE